MQIEQEDILKITNWNNSLYDSALIRMSEDDYLKVCHERGLSVDCRDYTLVAKATKCIKGQLVHLTKAWFMPEFKDGESYGRFMP